MKLRQDIKAQAKENFMSQYGVCVAALLVTIVITEAAVVIQSIINARSMIMHGFNGLSGILYMCGMLSVLGQLSFLLSIFLYPPVLVGYSSFALRIYRNQGATVNDIFLTGFLNYWRKVGGMLWMYLFTFLWTLLFVIPGIVKALAYSMTPYILADCPEVTATDALKLSMRMTYGYKGDIFVMGLSFIGWILLSALTFGIVGILYAGPYMGASFAGLYQELKNNALQKGVVRPEELGMTASI